VALIVTGTVLTNSVKKDDVITLCIRSPVMLEYLQCYDKRKKFIGPKH